MADIKVVNYIPWFEYYDHQFKQEKKNKRNCKVMCFVMLMLSIFLVG